MNNLKSALVFSMAILLVAGLAAFTYMNRNRTEDVISITGMGQLNFESDRIVWGAHFAETDLSLEKAYDKLNDNKALVEAYLKDSAVKPAEINFDPLVINKLYQDILNDKGAKVGEKFNGFELLQSFWVDSPEVAKITAISRDSTRLVKQGIELISGQPAYYFTKLADLKLKLIAAATQDAWSRAQEIATNSGAVLGKLRQTNLGVFQIIGSNASPDATSWDGAFDTVSRFKTATITIHAQYETR